MRRRGGASQAIHLVVALERERALERMRRRERLRYVLFACGSIVVGVVLPAIGFLIALLWASQWRLPWLR